MMSPSILLSPALVSVLAAPSEEPEAAATPALEAARGPDLGMQVRSVDVDTGAEQYALTPRVWADVVAENPALLRDQQDAELFAPGLVGVALGSLWLVIGGTVTLDEFAQDRREEARGEERDREVFHAREATFRFIIPAAILVTSTILATKGGRARRRLEGAKDAFYLGPQISQGGGGVSVGGRF